MYRLYAVLPRPLIFISAVSRELHSARQLVANTLIFLGYQPVWEDSFGTEEGDLREVLRVQIDQCKGVVQLVGRCYGAEPPVVDPEFGRVSYTQFEALYARKRTKKIWYLFIDERFPRDPCEEEPAELRALQMAYRERLQSDTHLFHPLASSEALEASVLKLRSDLSRLRRGVKQWAVGVTALLFLITALMIWQLRGEARMKSEMKAEMAKLRQGIIAYPQVEAQVRSQSQGNASALQEQMYVKLARELNVDPKILREKLPRLAEELKRAPNASPYERANASYVAKDYLEAERLALEAVQKAQEANPPNTKRTLQALELAGLSAHRAIQYNRAMEHFQAAEKLTDRTRNLSEWITLQHEIADLLIAEGKYSEAEKLLRNVTDVCTHFVGWEDPNTLDSRHRRIYTLTRQSKYAEAETEARDVLKSREQVLGPEHADTVVSRYNLADTLVERGKYSEAEALYREVIRLDEKLLGPEDPRTLSARVGLATVLGDEGKNVEAESLYREIIKVDERIYGLEHPNTLNDRQNLATALQADGKYQAAEAEYRDVIKLEAKIIGVEHPNLLTLRNNLAELLDDEGKFAEAEAECLQIIPLEQKVLGLETRLALNTRCNLAVALIGQARFPEAETQSREVISQMEGVLGLDHPDTRRFTAKLTTGLARQNRAEAALEIAKGAEDRAHQTLAADDPAIQEYSRLTQQLAASQ
jgi:tetratricopeptide (TPR) repeat protein